MKVGGGLNNEGLVFGYDSDGFKFSGEPTTNYIWHQNAIKQGSYTTYSATSSGSWNVNHRKAIQTVNSNGTSITGYVNTGVGDWTNTYHCIWEHDDELDKPVSVMYCYDGNWKAKSFGAGMSAWSTYGMSAGDKYTISWLQWTNNLTKAAYTGFYSKDTNGSWNFHDGLQAPTNTKTYTWERVYATYTVSGNRNLGDASGNVYMYGHSVGSNSRPTILKIADVQLELKNHPTKFSPTLTRTEAFNDHANTTSIDTSNILWTPDEYPDFNGSSTFIDLGSDIVFKNTGGWTVESIAKYRNVPGGYDNVISPGNFIGSDSIINNSWYWSVLNNKLELWNRSPGVWKYGSTTIQPETWYHAVLTCSDDGTSYQMYLNGEPEGGDHVSYVWNSAYSGLRVRYIGQGNSGNKRRVDGQIPVTRMYDRVLSANEVKQNYLSYKPRFGL